ncbi:MAG: hypothetical protein J6B00_01955 [Alphaproteobacteria bacterium]|nr:hypothetical protein [Alphaproteobacteria bacterium]
MNVVKLGELIEQWCAAGFPYLAEDERKPIEQGFLELFGALRQGDERVRADLEFLDSKFSKPILTDYDLKEHFSRLMQKCGVDEKQRALFENKLQVSDICAKVPMERLRDDRCLYVAVDKEADTQYQKRAENILTRIIEAKGQPNELLAEMLKDNPVIFYFEDRNGQDACMSEVFLHGKRSPLMVIEKGMMDAAQVNEDYLATTITHELGHWIDFASRPVDYFGKERHWQEYFADISGYQMAKNAGYDAQVLISEKEKFAKRHREWLTRTNKELPDKTIFEERVDLLHNMFGKNDKQVNTLSLIQAKQKMR